MSDPNLQQALQVAVKPHEFNSSLTCNYCGVAAESTPSGTRGVGDPCPERMREPKHTCPPLLDHGGNQLWAEVQSLTVRVAELEAQLTTTQARADAFQQEANTLRNWRDAHLAKA